VQSAESSPARVESDPLVFHSIPSEDPATYDMICKADTVGVFQIESRAQMSMLPRLKPRRFYDLVIEVAIVRPGPIQGDMVHPYLRRRSGEEPVLYPNDAIRAVLGKTLGVPLFQEQAMALAVVAAGFSAGQADELRRAIAAWKRSGNKIAQFGEALEQGMVARGYTPAFARQVFEQIKGFSGYGFPESHAASFAHLVYASAWLKRHHPAAFAAALLNSQPMGFYAPSAASTCTARSGTRRSSAGLIRVRCLPPTGPRASPRFGSTEAVLAQGFPASVPPAVLRCGGARSAWSALLKRRMATLRFDGCTRAGEASLHGPNRRTMAPSSRRGAVRSRSVRRTAPSGTTCRRGVPARCQPSPPFDWGSAWSAASSPRRRSASSRR
jgi:hypothetical protein